MRKPSRAERAIAQLSWPGYGRYNAGAGWQGSRAEQVKHFTGWVYVAIDSICKKVAQQKPGVYVLREHADAERKKKCLSGEYRRKAVVSLKPHEDLEPVKKSHPLCTLLDNPNNPDTTYDFWYETIMYLLLTGSTYWWLPRNLIAGRDGMGLPAEMWVLPSHWVWPVLGNDNLIEAYDLRPLFGGYKLMTVPAGDVVHIKFKSPLSKIDGYSPLTAISRWVDVAESVDISRWAHFDWGMMPGLAVLMDDAVTDQDAPQLRQTEEMLETKFRGPNNRGRSMIMGGVKDVKPIFNTPLEMDYGTGDDQTRDKVLAGYRVSKVIAGISTEVNRGSMDGAQVAFAEVTINPLLHMIGCNATEKVAWRFDKRLRVAWQSMVPDDPAQKLAEQQADAAIGAVTVNEVRKERGREPYKSPMADNPIMPMGVAPMPLNEDESDLDKVDPAALLSGQPPKPPGLPGWPPESSKPETGQAPGAAPPGAGAPPVVSDKPSEQPAFRELDDYSGKGNFDEGKHPRADDGKFGAGSGSTPAEGGKAKQKKPNAKAMLAKKVYKPSTAEKQRHAIKNEKVLARKLGGKQLPDNEPSDVELTIGRKAHALECKTFVDNGNDKVTMHKDSLARKQKYAKKTGKILHTVVIDDRDKFGNEGQHSGRRIWYRRGVGSYRLGGMQPVKNWAELKSLIGMSDAKLPEKARAGK